MVSDAKQINASQPTIINQFSLDERSGTLRLNSWVSRLISMISPAYYQKKVDALAQQILIQLKEQNVGSPSKTEWAKRVLQLSPSQPLAGQIQALILEDINLSGQAAKEGAVLLQVDENKEGRRVHFADPIAVEGPAAPPAAKALEGLSKRLENLGLTAAQQQSYPELMKVIQENELADYMEGTNWKLDHENWEGPRQAFKAAETGEPMLMVDGNYLLWSEAKDKIFGARGEDSSSWKFPEEQWRIDANGISSISMSKWSELTPCGKLKEHDGNYYFDFMSTTEGLNHNWIRLINSEGEVISAGLCGEIYAIAMMRNSVGKLNSPDHREFFKPQTHRSTRVCIDKETYEFIKKNKIETDQKTNNLFFSLMTRNCSKYACEIASKMKLEIDNAELPSQMGHRVLLNRFNVQLPTFLLKVIQKVTYVSRVILAMGASFAMGAWYQNSEVAQLEKQYADQWEVQPKKPFRSLASFFDGTNSLMSSTLKVGEWQQHVQEYRAARLAYVQSRKDEFVKQGLFNQDNPQTKGLTERWKELEREVAYEMPPALDSSHLFLKDASNIKLADLEARTLKALYEPEAG